MIKTTGLPFICSRCGLHYGNSETGPSLIRFAGPASNVTVKGNKMDCPRCGKTNRQALADDTYNVSEGRWELVREITEDLKGASPEDIQTLMRLVREARADDQDPAQVARAIEEQTSSLQRLAALVRKHPGVLSVLLSILLWLVPPPYDWSTSGGSAPPPPRVTQLQQMTPHQMDELAHKIAHDMEQDERRHEGQQGQHSKPAPAPGSLTRLHPQGRNKPCQCGSGIKFKRCCGGPHAKAS